MEDFALLSAPAVFKQKYTAQKGRPLTGPVRAGNFNQINEC